MVIVTYAGGNPVPVVLLILELKVQSCFFGMGSLSGKFESRAGDPRGFVVSRSVANCDIEMSLTEWYGSL